jgi:hypothetical protein
MRMAFAPVCAMAGIESKAKLRLKLSLKSQEMYSKELFGKM